MAETKRPTNPATEEILGKYFPVLDYGFVALKDYYGTDACIEEMARISYSGGGTRKENQTRGLLRYLRRHGHTSPFEGIELKFHMSMPIFVARQFIRHRTAGVSEISGRYSLLPMLFYTPQEEQLKRQSKSNKQGRFGDLPKGTYSVVVEYWNKNRQANKQLYCDLVSADIARELARIDLPLSTYTQWFFKIDVHNLLHFLTLRVDEHTQWESREYAKIIAGMLKRIAPLTYEAWVDYELCGKRFGREELEILRRMLRRQGDATTGNNLSKRELDEFFVKLDDEKVPDFELDLSASKSAEYFEKLMLGAVPKADRLENIA